MSGIAGIIRFDGRAGDAGLIKAMTASMAYRGPDGIDHWQSDGAALGQCMLRTTPESLEEHLPLASDQAPLVMVMDGRVDNWEELRAALLAHGALLRDRSDAELVLKAYQLWGEDCLRRIDGDFAFAIWNTDARSLFCSRDRMGARPFHYYRHGDVFVFASELQALLELPWVDEILNEGMIADWLACDFHSLDETLCVGIRRLVAAHSMTVTQGGESIARYWTPDLHGPVVYESDEQYAEHYLSLLTEIVRRQSRSQSAVAYEVSGGLDSSALFAIAANLQSHSRLLAPGLHAYTLSFPDDADANELEFSRAVSRHVGLPVQEIPPSFEGLDWYRGWAKRYREFPGYPNTVMASGIEQRAIAQGCRTVVSGVGGDEWLGGGGTNYADEIRARRWRGVGEEWRAECRQRGVTTATWHLLRAGLAAQLSPAVKKAARAVFASGAREPERPNTWLAPKLATLIEQRRSTFTNPQIAGSGMLPNQQWQLATLLDPYHALAREMQERLGASRGLDLRSPFQHSTMVQFAISTPDRLRRRHGVNKVLHRNAMKGLLPESVLERHSKAEFSSVFRQSLAGVGKMTALLAAQRHPDWVDSTSIETQWRGAISPGNEGAWARWQLWALLVCDPVHAAKP